MITIKDKLKYLGHAPYFLPCYTYRSTPIWDWATILMTFDCVPGKITHAIRKPWNPDKTLVIIESGGFAAVRPSGAEDCLKKQLRTFPDLCFTLDFPVKMKTSIKGRGIVRGRVCPYCSLTLKKKEGVCPRCGSKVSRVGGKTELVDLTKPQKLRRIQQTINCAKEAMELRDEYRSMYEQQFDVMAVIQGYDLKSLVYCTAEMVSFGYDFFAFGIVTTDASARMKTPLTIIEGMHTVRDIIDKRAWLHLLGLTDVRWLLRLYGLYQSFDSATITIHSKNATMMMPDGSNVSLARNISDHGLSSAKHLQHKPVTLQDYLDLQRINFKNYITYLNRTLWRN